MYRSLSDFRLLQLALSVEDTLEAYEGSLRDAIQEVPVRARLRILFEEGSAHGALRRAFSELGTRVQSFPTEADPQELLQTLLDCEHTARDFYLSQLDRLSDPRLVDLFRRLADEEATHIRAVEEAMDTLAELRRHRTRKPVPRGG